MLLQSFFLLLFLFSLSSAFHSILYKRDPRAAVGWVITCILLPGLGACFYWLFGVNRIRTRAKKLYRLGYWKHETKTGREEWSFKLPENHLFHEKDFQGILNVSEKVNRHPLMIGNRLEPLFNGEEAYSAMLTAIRGARKFIYLCTYIFNVDKVGHQFIQALKEAKERGVQVNVLVDAFGEHYSQQPVTKLLNQVGVRSARFLPISLSPDTLHFNLRNHRKSLVVDGRVGFTGGMNIRQKHLANFGDPGSIGDVHFKVEGPVVLELQEVFLEDWYFATRESLPWLAHPHELLPGDMVCRAISGGPSEDFEKINWLLLGALAWAKRKVRIMSPYFVPDRVMISALNTTALRGVVVEVVLPEKNNLPFVAWANRALLWEMLENGVRFYYQPGSFCHSKLFVVDESYSLIGSSNWDSRSLRLNFELDLEVYDSKFAGLLSKHFDQVKSASINISLEGVSKDPLLHRFRNSFFRLFSPYL